MMRTLILFFLTTKCLLAQDAWKDVYSERVWQERDRWQRASELIQELHLKPGSRVADVGCHEGYLTVKLAPLVGATGLVYAVDVEQTKLDRLTRILTDREIRNVKTVLGAYHDPRLPENALDAVIILDAYHEMKEHDRMLHHIYHSLKAGGRLVLCEPIADDRRTATRDVQERKHELGIKFAIEDLRKAGFWIVKQQDPFVDRTQEKGDTMWLLVAQKK